MGQGSSVRVPGAGVGGESSVRVPGTGVGREPSVRVSGAGVGGESSVRVPGAGAGRDSVHLPAAGVGRESSVRVPAAGPSPTPGAPSAGAVSGSASVAAVPGRSSTAAPAHGPSPSGLPVSGSPHAADPVAVLLTAAEQLGTAVRVCELAVQHAGTREQFGQPIGAFQAVKHLCAQMLVRAETARAAVYAAAVTADPVDVAAARLLADEAAERGARDCLQVHGGMGFTWECEVQLHLKRAWVRARRAGGGAESEELLAVELLA
ncbi:MAG: acyl-CoA dehydrogenase family protein [Streptomyces sp.]